MPDFERLTDHLSLDMATTPQQRAERAAYIRGKSRARIEIAIAAAVIATAAVLISLL